MFKYKIDVLNALKKAGYSTYRLGKKDENGRAVFGQSVMQKFRKQEKLPSWEELDRICSMLNCSPWDVIEYVKDPEVIL